MMTTITTMMTTTMILSSSTPSSSPSHRINADFSSSKDDEPVGRGDDYDDNTFLFHPLPLHPPIRLTQTFPLPKVTGLSDPRNLATFAFYAFYAMLAWHVAWPPSSSSSSSSSSSWATRDRATDGDYPAIVFGFFTLSLPFLPASNLLFPVGFVGGGVVFIVVGSVGGGFVTVLCVCLLLLLWESVLLVALLSVLLVLFRWDLLSLMFLLLLFIVLNYLSLLFPLNLSLFICFRCD